MTIRLEIVGPHGPDGYQDPETGEQFFNTEVETPYGILGNLKTVKSGDADIIVQADEVVLISRGIDRVVDPFGVQWLTVNATNGAVTYRLLDDALEWADIGTDEHADEWIKKQQLGIFHAGLFTPVLPVPDATRREVTTKELDLVTRQEKS